jgi:twitching motility protein PilT
MEEPTYRVPAVDANGLPLQPPEPGRRRESLAPPPTARRADTSMFAPPELPGRSGDLDSGSSPVSWQAPLEAPPSFVAPAQGSVPPVYDMPPMHTPPADVPPPAYEAAAEPQPSFEAPPALPSHDAPRIPIAYDLLADEPVYELPGTPAVYDLPPAAPIYDVAPAAPVYDLPPVPPAAPVYDLPVAPVYDLPPVVAPEVAPPVESRAVYDLPPYVAPSTVDAAPSAPPPPVYDIPAAYAPTTGELPRVNAAPQVYDLSSDAAYPSIPAPAPLLPQEPPKPAPFPAPLDEPLAPVGQPGPKGDLLGALREVLFRGASDLHISAGAPPMLRIDGALAPIQGAEPWSRETVRSTLLALLSAHERERFDSTLELDFAYTLTSNARFRVNYYQDRGSMSAAFRIIPNEVKQLAQLGIPAAVASFATLPRGLVLVTGPTGSGKSTTLAALIDIVNSTRTDHIMTVEDPIEFLHRNKKSLVHQREVGRDTHSFSSALKHVLRQDPDVILIGELRDLETISTALTAAETGHLVFATLHTQDAAQTIDRIIDVYPPHQQMQIRSQLASTLQGIVSQTLVKRASGAGRVVAAEVLVMTPAIGNLIREGKTFQIGSAMQAGRAQGMSTLDQHLAELVNAGAITRQSAIDKARDIASMTRMITRVDIAEQPDGSFGSFAAPDSPTRGRF